MQCHLLVYGIDQSYKPWVSHGESAEQTNNNEDGYREEVSDNDDEIDEMPFDDMAPFVFDATNAWNSINSTPVNENEGTTNIGLNSGTHETPSLLQKLMEDMEADLYPGCKTFKRLEFIMSLLHIKVSNKWSDKSFSMLLNALHMSFNYDNNLPSSSYEAKKYTKALGLDYVRIDACVNHCVLFRKEYANEVKCPKCLAPRWKQDVSQDDEGSYEDEGAKRKTRVPQLVLHHFPLIPRLQRMFMCSKIAMHMRWHKKKHFSDDDDGIMRHPRDSKSWKSLDELYPDFAADARNTQQHGEEASTNEQATMTNLTYREKRRLEQAELRLKFPDRKRRGPTRGKKYASRVWNSNSEEKIKINFMDELRRVVGKKANEFICDWSNWVKEFCPLKSLNWSKMDSGAKERLYKKIRSKYDLPDMVAGANVTEALSFQCSMLYKHWRFRLKEQYFRNKSVTDAINSRPDTINANQWTWLVCEYWNDEKQKRISKVNTENKLKQTETPANGAKSTARIFHELMNVQQTQGSQEHEGSSDDPLETQQDPLYITLFEKTKKHKDRGFEPNAEKDYEALRNLHEKEVEEHGEDTLSVKAAYMEVFKPKSGYVKGLGPGARPPKKRRVERETDEVRVALSVEIQQLKEDAATREGALVSQIESMKESNEELKTSNEELIASNDELKATVSRINIEAQKREKKLRDDMMKMFEQLRYDTFSSSI
uniref:Uncharacterized protein n=1 Tax=Chenopodium quinoa TaxID=63459 RepID=A0A803KV28_CHEQI